MKLPSPLLLGCMGFGAWNQNAVDDTDRRKAFIAIEAALEHGINSFDHADIYTYGKAEILFGEYLENHKGLRETLFIQSKAGIILNSSNTGSNTYNNTYGYLLARLENSLKQLKTDYLDSFLIHRYDPLVSPQELSDSLCRLQEIGLTKTIGLSNMPPALCTAMAKSCRQPLRSWQVQLSLGQSQLLQANTFYNLRQDGIQNPSIHEYFNAPSTEIQAWGPLDKGAFMSPEALATKNETALLLQQLAEEKGCSPEAVQIAWLLKLPFKVRPIIGSTRPDRIAACAQAMHTELSHAEWYNLWISALKTKLP